MNGEATLSSRDVTRNALYNACETLRWTYGRPGRFTSAEWMRLVNIHAEASTAHLSHHFSEEELARQLDKVVRTLRKLGKRV